MGDDAASASVSPLDRAFIVVGVDGSEGSRAALRFACDEARLRGAAVYVVHAWWAIPELDQEMAPTGEERGTPVERDAKRMIEAFCLETLGDPSRGLEVDAVPVQGVAASVALLEAARGAQLLVVGSRGAGGFRKLLLGSVSEQCIHHAGCPVVVVHGGNRAGD